MTVLAAFAHPDDEAWSAAGTLLRLARTQRVVVACATRGEAGIDQRGVAASPTELAAIRTAEMQRACARLGVELRWLDLPDGGLDDVPGNPLVPLVDELAPSLLLTLGDDGGYGHRDHVAMTRWARATGAPVATAVFPPELFRPVYRRLKRTGLVVPGLQTLGGEPEVVVPVEPGEREAALACHASQLRAGPLSLLPGLERLPDSEGWAGAVESLAALA